MNKIQNTKPETLSNHESQNSKPYNLGSRTTKFTKRVVAYVNELQKSVAHIEIGKQLIRAAGSVGANYIEAEEALSRKDFIMRIKISRKEAKEARYWLDITEPKDTQEKEALMQEATELTKIFGSIVEKSKKSF